MPDHPNELALDIDLQGGVVPISKAASSLAALIKRARERQQPIIVTQKGYPTGVLLPIDLYVALRARAEVAKTPAQEDGANAVGTPDVGPETIDNAAAAQPGPTSDPGAPPPAQPRRGGRRKRSEEA